MQIQENNKTEETKTGGLSGIFGQVSDMLGRSSENKEEDGHEFLNKRLGRFLDANYSLLINYTIPNLPVEIPMVLVGPPGVQVIYPHTQPGIFKAQGDSWYEMNDRKQEFELAKENLVKRTFIMAKELQKFLEACGVNLKQVSPVMLLSDAGIHVDTSSPAIRIVPKEAIDKYATGLIQASQILNKDAVLQISNLITRPATAKAQMAQVKGQANRPAVEAQSAAAEDRVFPAEDEVPDELPAFGQPDDKQPDFSKPADDQPDDEQPDFSKPVDDQPDDEQPDFSKPVDDQPEWMTAISVPEEVEEQDLLDELLEKYSPAKIVALLGFNATQWVIIAAIFGVILLTAFVAFLVLFF